MIPRDLSPLTNFLDDEKKRERESKLLGNGHWHTKPQRLRGIERAWFLIRHASHSTPGHSAIRSVGEHSLQTFDFN